MMTSQILKSVDFTKTQKSRHLENETLFFSKKNSLITHQRLLHYFVAEVTFNTRNRGLNLKNTLCTLCPVPFFHIFSGYLHFDALIIGSQICLIMGQTLAEGTI